MTSVEIEMIDDRYDEDDSGKGEESKGEMAKKAVPEYTNYPIKQFSPSSQFATEIRTLLTEISLLLLSSPISSYQRS
jgi:hypothetical protein